MKTEKLSHTETMHSCGHNENDVHKYEMQYTSLIWAKLFELKKKE